jgi:hypothetical protein
MAIPPDTTSPMPPAGQKCTAVRGNGKPCGRWPILGGTVCMAHGGAAPQVREAANRRLQRDQMRRDLGELMAELEVDAAGRGPTELLLDVVYRSHAMVQVIGAQMGKVGSTLTRKDRYQQDQPHVLIGMYDQALDRASRAAKAALDAGVAEALVRVEQEKGRILAEVMRAIFADPELGLTEEQRAVSGKVAGRHLRVLTAG